MKVLYFCASWGLHHLDMETMLDKIKSAGFDGIETDIPTDKTKRKQLKTLLESFNLQIIAHQYLADASTPKTYIDEFRNSLYNAADFNPKFINSHTGKDFWSFEENLEILDAAQQLEDELKTKIVHETHRGRFLYSAPMAKLYFEARKSLKINLDISHWCCVSESLLEQQEETVFEALRRTEHIHARIGHAQGPQISDPTDKFWQTKINVFFKWWRNVYQRFKDEQRNELTITPEFGPMPYTSANPSTGKPLNDFFEKNCRMKRLLQAQLK